MIRARLLAPDLPFDPIAPAALPSLAEARTDSLPHTPRVYQELASRYVHELCRVHYHTGLVRIVDAHPGIAGLRLKGLEAMGDPSLSRHAKAVLSPELSGSEARKSGLSRAEKALSALRGSLPSDRSTIEYILGFGPLDPKEERVLTSGNAAAYLARLRIPEELGVWLGTTRNKETLGVELPPAPARRGPRI